MIMFSHARVIRSLNHPQVPAWIDFNLGVKKKITLCISAEPSLCGVVLPPRISMRILPTVNRRCFACLYQPINVNPVSIYSGSEGRSCSPRSTPRGVRVALGKTGSVCPPLSPCYLCVCMHTQLSLSLTCHSISQLWPHIAMVMAEAWRLWNSSTSFFFFKWEGFQLFLIELLYTCPPFLSLFTNFQPHWRECFSFALHLVKRGLLVRLCSQSIIIWIWRGNITTHRPKWSINATLLI